MYNFDKFKVISGFVTLLTMLGVTTVYSQSSSFSWGAKPNNLRGSFFATKYEFKSDTQWSLSVGYNFVKYVESNAIPNRTSLKFHIQNKTDMTFIEFSELHRGQVVQINERDFRPKSLRHRFSTFVGYEIFSFRIVEMSIQLGPHFNITRDIYPYIIYNTAETIIEEGDDVMVYAYSDYQIDKSWDVGIGSVLGIDVFIFKNLSVGINFQGYFDAIDEGLDVMAGIHLNLHFLK